jgi:putative ABC transport system permease protein
MLRDLLYAARTLRKAPGLWAAAVFTLAMGIGGTSAVFTIVNRTVIDPLPYPDSERLVLIWGSKPHEGLPEIPFSQPDFEDLRASARSFDALGAWALDRGNASAGGEPAQVQYAIVTASLFPHFGVQPLAGRLFRADEDRPGAPLTAVISHGFWTRQLAGRPEAIGRTINLDDRAFEVVGVLPADFRFLTFPGETDVWLPFGADPSEGRRFARGLRSLGVIGRLAPGVALPEARAEVDAIAATLASAYPRFNTGRRMVVVPLRDQVTRGVRTAGLVFMAGVAMVLLIACANVTGLLLARGAGRHRELVIRRALGASRGRLVRQQLAESVVIGAGGGVAGLLLASWLVDLLVRLPYRTDSIFVPYSVARSAIGLDATALVVTAGVTLLSALLAGVVPALVGSRAPELGGLRGTRPSTDGRAHRRVRASVVAVQVALSVVLLVTAALTLRTLTNLQRADPGFSAEGVLTVSVALSEGSYREPAAVARYYQTAVERIAALPGVAAVGAVQHLPLSGLDASTGFFIEGRPEPARADEQQTHYRTVTPGYFTAMRIPIVRGRGFTERDAADASRVALINEAMAKRFWPGEDPIGKRVALDFESMRFFRDRPPVFDIPGGMREIVGVVKDIRHTSLLAEPVPEMYTPGAQRPEREMSLVVRTAGEIAGLPAAVRDAVRSIDPSQPVGRIEPVSNLVSSAIAPPRANSVLLTTFAAVALALAMVGVFGLLSYSVVSRTPELGIRLALGGSPGHLRALILREAFVLVAAGGVLGIAGALIVGRSMQSLLVGVAPADPTSLAGAVLVLLAVAAVASYLPARRATAIDPVSALRSE